MILHAPSWLLPGSWLENADRAAEEAWLSGLELLFFSYDESARAELHRELPGLTALAPRLSYSLHLPDPLGPEDLDLVELTKDLVEVYVLHPPAQAGSGAIRSGALWAELLGGLRSRYGERFLLEYTGREPFARAEALCPGLPLCADTGRLLLDGENPATWMTERGERLREIHLHAIQGGKDHAPLRAGETWLVDLLPRLIDPSIRIVVEVFSLAGVRASAAVLSSLIEAVGTGETGARP